MNFSIMRVKALFMKELKDYYRNLNVLITFLAPVIFICLLGFIPHKSANLSMFLFNFSLNYGIGFICLPSIAMLIAEEKEKNTLDVLTLSSVTSIEFLVSKILLPFSLSLLALLISFISFKINIKYLPGFFIIELMCIISVIIIGATIGMLCDNLTSSSMISIIVLIFIMAIPSFSNANRIFNTAANFLGSYHSNLIIKNITNGYSIFYSKYSLFIVFIWIIIPIFIFILSYNKRQL